MTRTRTAVLATTALVGVLLAAGWFLLVSPERGEAAELRTRHEEQVQANAVLRARLETLREQRQGLPEQRAQLDRALAALPDDPRLPDLVRTLSRLAREAGADLSSIVPGKPVDPAPAVPGATGTTPTPGTPTATDPAAATPAGATGSPAGTSAGALRSVPLTLQVSGEYVELERFLHLVEKLDRPLLVTGFTLGTERGESTGTTAAAATTAGGTGSASAARGPVTISITGRTFMVDRSAASAPAPGTVPAPAGEE